MRKIVLLDTCVWVSYFSGDSNYFEARNIILNATIGNWTIFLPDVVIGEIVVVLARNRVSHQKIKEYLKDLLENTTVVPIYSKESFWSESLLETAARADLKTNDAFILANIFTNKVEKLYTFDKKLKKAYEQIKTSK